ncbi:hypothetical protein ACJRO7_013613 [Eucalyptus globulus]|uniref:TIR domain-containing protein n=1 Tax=Eucalyptus globulus TaxID=34317 RepID=A0ABD3L3N1_EUCGL
MEYEKRKRAAEAASSTGSKLQRREELTELPSDERESRSSLPDSLEKTNVPSESKSNSGPSASHTSAIGNNYYVFLSFRGPDTRKGFVDHLYHKLVDKGLPIHPNFVFRDENDLLYGKPIESLLSVIEHSKVSIPVISKDYAASEWCLRELIQIMKCKKKDKKSLPCFTRYEGKLIQELVEIIMREQQHDFPPSSPKNLVGIDDRMTGVMNLADTTSETRIIVIYGIGGVGKTTLATIIYKKLFDKFDCRSFLKDIRETIKNKGLEHVQSLLISNITNSKHRKRVSGIGMIQSSCKNKKVLILLDDVDSQYHLDNLIGDCNFESGSRIIITCRDKAFLKNPEFKEYELKELNSDGSLLLFGKNAFGGNKPPTELADLTKAIVDKTGGLPLALVIIGSFLKGKDISMWREALEKLKVPHMNVQQKLRISYDSLEYEEQQMFLDIACFLIGIEKRIAAYMWEDLQYCPHSGLKRMIELSLMKIDDNNELRMHDLLRDLGRAIARPADKKPWKCSRLWDEEAIIIQRSKEENRYIEALRLDENGSNMFMNQRNFERMPYLKFLHLSKVAYVGNFEDSLSELRWLEWEKCPNCFGVTNLHLEKLLILDLSYGYISHEWRGWSSIKMERLKVINLSHCFDLVITPNLSAFKSLEILILEYCHNLEEIDPSIGDAKCLTSLNLSDCHKLEKLPSQLGELKRLISLNLSSCETLEELPKEMGELKELKTLDLRWCDKFKELPNSIGSLVKLQCLLLGNMTLPSEGDTWYIWDSSADYQLDDIPNSIGELESLTELHLTCAKISKLPESIGDLKILKILKIAGCKELSKLPSTLSELGKLEELDATACDNLAGGVPINGLFSLKILQLGKLGHAVYLVEFHEEEGLSLQMFERHLNFTNCKFPTNLTVLEVTCKNRKLRQLCHLIHLKKLSFQSCKFLKSIPLLPSGILNLCIVFCGKLKKLPSLLKLESLSELLIIGCGKLMKIKGLEGLKSLGRLFLCECKKLPNLNGLEHLESLRKLELEDLNASLMNLFQVHCLGRLKNLEWLCIARCQSLTTLDISQLMHMRVLLVFECEKVVEIKGLEELKELTRLDIKGCKFITKLPDLSPLENLRHLDIRGSSNLRDIRGLERVEEVIR